MGLPWIPREGRHISYVMIHNLNLIMKKHQTSPSRGISHKAKAIKQKCQCRERQKKAENLVQIKGE